MGMKRKLPLFLLAAAGLYWLAARRRHWRGFEGRVVLITGGTRGLGLALARRFLSLGARVAVCGRDEETLERAREQLGHDVFARACDVTEAQQVRELVREVERRYGRIDVLINNAGVQIVERVEEVDPARARSLLELDLWVPLALTRALLPAMLARRAGTIVDIASVAALAPTPGMWHYNAAKGGLAAASESLRGELRRTGVHVVTVYPGPVATAMAEAGYAAYPPDPVKKLLPEGDAATLARRVRRAVERRQARVIYPRAYAITRWFPAVTRWFLDRFTPRPLPLAERAPPVTTEARTRT